MAMEDRTVTGHPGKRAKRWAAAALLLTAAAGGLVLGTVGCGTAPPPGKGGGVKLFQQWPADHKPDAVLVLSGEQNGYALPCGCSRPQPGGLARRYNFLKSLAKERAWALVPVDVGDVAQPSGPQAQLKYQYLMSGLKLCDYKAVCVGENEM